MEVKAIHALAMDNIANILGTELLKHSAHQSSSHINDLYEAGFFAKKGGKRTNVAINQGATLCRYLASMHAPRLTSQSVVASTHLLTALLAALGAVDWKRVVADMHGYQPKRLSRAAARAYVDVEPEKMDEVDAFVSLRLDEAANLPEVLLFMLHLSLRASCSGFFRPFQEPDLLPHLAGTDTNIWAVYADALTALLEAHPLGFTASSPNAAYMADDILHVRGATPHDRKCAVIICMSCGLAMSGKCTEKGAVVPK